MSQYSPHHLERVRPALKTMHTELSLTGSREFTLTDFDFELPPELIAQHPTSERSASRCAALAGRMLRNQFRGKFEIKIGQREFTRTGQRQLGVHGLEGRTDPFQVVRAVL